MPSNLYTENEIVLCTYAALYDVADLGGVQYISSLTERTCISINSKIRNFAALLDKKGIPRISKISPLTGRTKGEPARETNWDIVEPLTRLGREDLLTRCHHIITTVGTS